MIGKELTPMLLEMENSIIEFEINLDETRNEPNYPIEGFRAATKIFMSAIMDRMWKLQENENIEMEDRIKMVTKAGNDLRNFVKTYTNIDTFDLYK